MIKMEDNSKPHAIFYHELEALFTYDNDVDVSIGDFVTNTNVTPNEPTYFIIIKVKGTAKYNALNELLYGTRRFDNVVMHIRVVDADMKGKDSFMQTLSRALKSNPVLVDVKTGKDGCEYALFSKDVAQIEADNPSDLHGLRSMLYQDIAKDVFGEHTRCYYCTATDEDTEYDLDFD